MSASDKKQQRKANLVDGLTQRQIKEQTEAKAAKKKKNIYIAVGLICAVAAAALLVWNGLNNFQGRAVAATVDGVEYKVADLQYYYSQVENTQYAMWYQMFTSGVSSNYNPYVNAGEQYYDESEGITYADYFREIALSTLQSTAALCNAAKAEGYTLSAKGQATIDEQLRQIDLTCAQYNLTRNSYFAQYYGNGVTEKVFLRNYTNDVLASEYEQYHLDSLTYTDEELLSYYEEHTDELDSYDYRTFFISGDAADPVDENGDPLTDDDGNTITATDEDKEAALAEAKSKADAAVTEIETAEDREAKFIEIAPNYVAESSKDSYSDPSYSLAEKVLGSSLSNSNISSWLMDSQRVSGDVTTIEASNANGYYVVLFLDRYWDQDNTVDIRHILIKAETSDADEVDENGSKIPSQEAMDAAKAKAEALLEEWKAGDATAESFGALASEYSDDTGSSSNGGKYTYVTKGYMVPNFDAWIFDPSRQPGDTGLVENNGSGGYYGWHIMYFEQVQDPSWKGTAIKNLRSVDQAAWTDEFIDNTEAVAADGMKYVGDQNNISALSSQAPAESEAVG